MKINFDQMPDTVLQNFKGGEGRFCAKMHSDDHGKIMRGLLAPGCSIGLHAHEGNYEVIYILSGTGKVLYDGAYISLTAGDCHFCPEGHSHSLINDSQVDLVFLGVVPERHV